MRLHARQAREVTTTANRQYGLITHRQAQTCGIDDHRIFLLLRRREWGHFRPHVYSIRAMDAAAAQKAAAKGRPWDRILLKKAVKAAQLSLGPAAIATGPTAARLWGIEGLPLWDGHTIHVSMPAMCKGDPLPGVVVNSWLVHRVEAARLHGLRLTTPERTLRDTVLCVDREAAVSLMDSALNRGLLRWRELDRQAALNVERAGSAASVRWWWLADPRARSPLETRIRLACADAGASPDDLYRPLPLPDGTHACAPLWWNAGAVADPSGTLTADQRAQLLRAHPRLHFFHFTDDHIARKAAMTAEVAAFLAARGH